MTRAPRRFVVLGENDWRGQPSVAYGVVRRLAYEQRRASHGSTYIRVFLFDVGRRGDPWGGLGLEVNGQVYRFGAGVNRWPEYHNGYGELTEVGKMALASGVPGFLKMGCDWRWVQDELDLTHLFTQGQINQVALNYADLMNELLPTPRFQAWIWSKRLGTELLPGHYNCTTFILDQFRKVGRPLSQQKTPLPAFDALLQLSKDQDQDLHALLAKQESELMASLLVFDPYLDWGLIAKFQLALPRNLSLSSLV